MAVARAVLQDPQPGGQSRQRAGTCPRERKPTSVETAAGRGPGDVLTFPQGAIRVVRVEALGERRGPAPEAQALYDRSDARNRAQGRCQESEDLREKVARPNARSARA